MIRKSGETKKILSNSTKIHQGYVKIEKKSRIRKLFKKPQKEIRRII